MRNYKNMFLFTYILDYQYVYRDNSTKGRLCKNADTALEPHGRIQKISLGGGGGGWGILTTVVLVINVFHRGPYEPPSRNNWTPWVQLPLEGVGTRIFKDICSRLGVRTPPPPHTHTHTRPPPPLDLSMNLLVLKLADVNN